MRARWQIQLSFWWQLPQLAKKSLGPWTEQERTIYLCRGPDFRAQEKWLLSSRNWWQRRISSLQFSSDGNWFGIYVRVRDHGGRSTHPPQSMQRNPTKLPKVENLEINLVHSDFLTQGLWRRFSGCRIFLRNWFFWNRRTNLGSDFDQHWEKHKQLFEVKGTCQWDASFSPWRRSN